MGIFNFFSKDKKETLDQGLSKTKESVFSKISRAVAGKSKVDDEVLDNLEEVLITSDVGVETTLRIIGRIEERVARDKYVGTSELNGILKEEIAGLLAENNSDMPMDFDSPLPNKPYVIMVVGVNGVGKTTTIGKLANYYLKKGYTPVIAAADTFRAGAIEQVNYHADKVGVKLIKHQKGSDPAAVAFDAVEHAKAQGKELVLIDTAGRMQTNTNLMDEMKKIKRVAKPDLVVFVGDALTGNDATQQASKFNEAIDLDGVILTKADADSKGGASLSIGYVIKKPILFLGMGQGYDDIKEYDADWMLNQLFSESGEEVNINEA